MEPNTVSGVSPVKLPLEYRQTRVVPGYVAQTHLLNDRTDKAVTEVRTQPLGEVP